MDRIPVHRLLAALLLVLVGTVSAGETSLAQRVDRYLEPFVEGRNFLGSVLIARGDEILVDRGYGLANVELGVPNGPGTRYHIASISKAFTAAAVLLLEERGLLRTTDPLSATVPEFPHGSEITLLHLLTHTSGIPNVNDLPEYAQAQRFPQTPASLMALFEGKPLAFGPGSRYAYSNSNYNLLALIIERLGKKPYGEFLEENIFRPLRLSSTGHDGDAADIIPGRASGYAPRGVSDLANAPWIDWSAKTGNGSLYSTTRDLLTFVRSFAAGKIVRPENVSRAWTEKPGNNFGWFARQSHGEFAAASNGRSPGFTSSLEYYPAREITVIVLSNSYSPVSQSPIAADLASLVLGQPVAPSGPILPVPLDLQSWKRIAGQYVFGPDFYRPGVAVSLRLEKGEPVLDWGGGFLSVLIPTAPGEFLDRQYWARIRVNAAGDGFTYSLSGSVFTVKRAAG